MHAYNLYICMYVEVLEQRFFNKTEWPYDSYLAKSLQSLLHYSSFQDISGFGKCATAWCAADGSLKPERVGSVS